MKANRRRARLPVCVILSGLALGGCAGGPKLAEVPIPPLPPDQGRVYFYRTSLVGAGVQPSIRLNGETVGSCEPRGVFYLDLKPGDYRASVSTEVEHELTFALTGGEEKFVRCYISIGVFVGHANLELVSSDEAHGEIGALSFTGR